MGNVKVAIVRPANDEVAKILASWGAAIFALPPDSQIIYRDLYGGAVTRAAVEIALADNDAIVFFCHGRADALLANDEIMDVANVRLASGRVCLAIACHSARELGEKATMEGVRAYLGFNDVFWTIIGRGSEVFGSSVLAGITTLLEGATVDEAATAMRDAFSKAVDYFRKGDGRNHPRNPVTWLLAHWNATHIQANGDVSARLFEIASKT